MDKTKINKLSVVNIKKYLIKKHKKHVYKVYEVNTLNIII